MMLLVLTLFLLLFTLSGPAAHEFPRFENVTEQSAIRFLLTSGLASKPYIPESMSGGLGFIDFDSDGWIDIYLVNGSSLEAERTGENQAVNRLFRNNRNGTFTDVTEEAQVGDSKWGMGVCVGDVNNDGLEDLYVTNFGPNVLYLNNGDGTFRDFSRESGTDDPSWSSSAAFADYDQDGDLDLYVSNYLLFDVHRPPVDTALCRYRGIRVQCGPRGLPAQPDRFFENRGDGRFLERTREVGMAMAQNYYGMGVVWGDYDNDGDPDLFVANDSTPNFLFQNNGDATFTETALIAGVAFSGDGKEQAGMGVDFSDFDNDGDLDLFVTNFSDDTNTLYKNLGGGLFEDATREADLAQISWQALGWGTVFADVDLDGWEDLLVANGHVFPQVDQHETGTSFRQSNFVFRNLQNGRFQDITGLAGRGFSEVRSSRGLAVGDINNDGSPDLLISNLDEAPSLLVNRGTQGNWLLLKLKGMQSNRSAIGARVYLRAGDLTRMREVKSGGSYQSQSDLRVHFGIGQNQNIDLLQVRWPSGAIQELKNIRANQILTLRERAEADSKQ